MDHGSGFLTPRRERSVFSVEVEQVYSVLVESVSRCRFGDEFFLIRKRKTIRRKTEQKAKFFLIQYFF